MNKMVPIFREEFYCEGCKEVYWTDNAFKLDGELMCCDCAHMAILERDKEISEAA